MPNHCSNNISITGSEETIKRIEEKYFTDGTIDFDKIIPLEGRDASSVWGTKWNSYDFEFDFEDSSSISGYFNTAWSGCNPVIITLLELEPDINLEYTYDEPGCLFGGEINYIDFEVEDNFYEDSDYIKWSEQMESENWSYQIEDWIGEIFDKFEVQLPSNFPITYYEIYSNYNIEDMDLFKLKALIENKKVKIENLDLVS